MSDIRVASRPVVLPSDTCAPAPAAPASAKEAKADAVERVVGTGERIRGATIGAGAGLMAASAAGIAAAFFVSPEYAAEIIVVGTLGTATLGAIAGGNNPRADLVGKPGSAGERAARGGAVGALVGTALLAGLIAVGIPMETEPMGKAILGALGIFGQPFVAAASAGVGAAVALVRRAVGA